MPVSGKSDQFILHRLRAKPIEYTVRIRHFVGSGGKWMMGVTVNDIGDGLCLSRVSPESAIAMRSVADDLRRAIEILEEEQPR